MATTRILDADHKLLQELGRQTGKQHQEIVREALDMYQRGQLLDEINETFGRLKADRDLWTEGVAEREAWDDTASDGLTHE